MTTDLLIAHDATTVVARILHETSGEVDRVTQHRVFLPHCRADDATEHDTRRHTHAGGQALVPQTRAVGDEERDRRRGQ